MRYLILLAAFCFPSVSSATNYLCLPEVTVGWVNNDNPNDIRIIEPQHKWLLQPIEPRKIAFAYFNDQEQEMNYSLTKLGETKEYGFCSVLGDYGFCYEFNWPGPTPFPDSDNKLSILDHFKFQSSKDGSAAYVFSDVGNQQFYGTKGVPNFKKPQVAIERGNCDAF